MTTTTSVDAGDAEAAVGLRRVPDVLPSGRLAALREWLRHGAVWDDVCGLMPEDEEARRETRGTRVDLATYLAAGAEERYFHFRSTRSWSYRFEQRSLDASCPLSMAELAGLLRTCRRATGAEVSMVRLFGREYGHRHFVGPHHENRLERVVTAHLFLTPGWTADQGGELRLVDHRGLAVTVVPRENELVTAPIAAVASQEVTPVRSDGLLHCFQLWFYR